MSETRENGNPWWPEELITREGKYADFLLVDLDAPSCTHCSQKLVAKLQIFSLHLYNQTKLKRYENN